MQELFWEPAHFVMERKTMLTIKQLAEREHRASMDAGQATGGER